MSVLLSPQQDEFERLIEGLSQLATYSIGRQPDNSIVIINNKISGKHAQLIQCTPNNFVLVDLDSKNGTFVNGSRITRKVVDKRDALRLADVDYTLDQLLALLKRDVPEAVKKDSPKNEPAIEKDKVSFTKEFAGLQQVYEQYPRLKRDCRNREKMIRTGSVILSSAIGIGAAVMTGGGRVASHSHFIQCRIKRFDPNVVLNFVVDGRKAGNYRKGISRDVSMSQSGLS